MGADWIVMGRWSHLDTEIERLPGDLRYSFGQALIEIRVREATSRRILLEDSFSGFVRGPGASSLLRRAAVAALQGAAERIARL